MPLLPLPRQVPESDSCDCSERGHKLTDHTFREEGFTIFKNGSVRRLSSTHCVVKSQELKDGKWLCDCQTDAATCPHLYAAQFHRYASKEKQDNFDEAHLKCRYCSSLDIASCGFRYGARGISKRFVCRDCLRKFSIPYTNISTESKPQELTWLLNQVGQLTSKLMDLLQEISAKLETMIATESPYLLQPERESDKNLV